MDTLYNDVDTQPKPHEKERLEILDKKADIQKKMAEIRREDVNLDEIIYKRGLNLDEHRLTLDKISEIRMVLSDITIDEERTLMASEPFLTPTIIGERREFVINKLMDLIKKI